ncbi:MAG: hypothetical protein ACRYGM_12690, partial [Janthinobacterium lividum]
MLVRSRFLGATLAAGFLAANPAAGAVLTSSLAAWQAAAGQGRILTTANTGLFNPLALALPTTSGVPLADGSVVGLSIPAQVTQPENGFPYLLAGGGTPDLFIPVNAGGTQVTTETLTPGGLTAFGFSVVPFSSSLGGPFTITVRTSDGQSLSASLPGGSFNTGTTTPAFFGYYGGPVSSLTLTTTDSNGFAFGNFTEVAAAVPEPASL